jgi:hypothetical protein
MHIPCVQLIQTVSSSHGEHLTIAARSPNSNPVEAITVLHRFYHYSTRRIVMGMAVRGQSQRKRRNARVLAFVVAVLSLILSSFGAQPIYADGPVEETAHEGIEHAMLSPCNVTAHVPSNNMAGEVEAIGEASCPNNTNWKQLEVCLKIDNSWWPDEVLDCGYDDGIQTYYIAAATGCKGWKNYYTQVKIDGQITQSARVALDCN